MQPYFFPYIGYFQLMNAVDEFVVYDNIEYTRKGWISRNRILVNGRDSYVTLPIKKDSDYLDVRERFLADSWPLERGKMLNRIKESYCKAPFFKDVFPFLERLLFIDESNLFKFLLHTIEASRDYLGITSKLLISSTLTMDHTLRSDRRVLEICRSRDATVYINPIGGTGLYDRVTFGKDGIDLRFLKANDLDYIQFNNDFIPWLSIIDVMMFNPRENIQKMLQQYSLV